MRSGLQLALAGLLLLCSTVAVASGTVRGVSGFIDFTPHGTQPGLAHTLQGSQNCTGCHGGGPQENHFPANGWSGSMMANATRDPLFWAALDVANADGAANGAEGIGEWCLRCHTPKGWYEGRVRKTTAIPPGETPLPGEVVDGFQGCLLEGGPAANDDSGNDFGGVGCHACHRVMEQGPLGQPLMSGNADIWLDDADCEGEPGAGPCRAGPYAYPVDMGGWDYEPPHAWKHSPLHSDSAICGSCHDVTSPTLDNGPFRTLILTNGTAQGHDTGLAYPIERTYSEWQQSAYASTLFRDGIEPGGDDLPGRIVARTEHCQHCHMPQAQPPSFNPDAELLVCSMGGPNRSGNLPTHELVGGNAWIPQILKGEYPGLKRDPAFDRTSFSATLMLAERTAQVETRATRIGNSLSLQVKVTNLAGHKLPSGYGEGRRMWLDVDVRDASGASLWRNGAFDPATGDLAIDAQTKIYEIKQGLWDDSTGTCRTKDGKGRDIFHFALNNCVAKDNRIPPLGFTGGGDPETASYGYSYAETTPGSGVSVNFDITNYSVPLPADVAWPVTVDARMKYQIASKDYIEFLRDQALERGFPGENALCADGPGRPYAVGPQDKSRGQYMYDLWANPAYGRSPPLDAGQHSVIVQAP